MFDFIAYPLANLTVLLYSWLGNSTIAAIAVLTLLINLVMLPLTLTQQRSARKAKEIQPELEKLRKKYGNDRERMAQEQMKLYKEKGINPMGGCLPLFPTADLVWPARSHQVLHPLHPVGVVSVLTTHR